MIYEHSRATRANEAVLVLSTLFAKSLHNDDVQDFDVRWTKLNCQQVKHLLKWS